MDLMNDTVFHTFLYQILPFVIKAFIVIFGILIVIIIPIVLSQKNKIKKKVRVSLNIENVENHFKKYLKQIKKELLTKKEFKKYLNKANEEKEDKSKPNSFVLSFNGDMLASRTKFLRDEISLILQIAKSEDEVIVILESRGGSVAHYGLAGSQLERLREKNIPLTVCVDTIAGSGGYLMACVANKILSAPFAIVGSIGVIFTIHNLNKLLKKHDIEYQEITAGKFKRTVTMFGELNEEKKAQLKKQLSDIHTQFKNFVIKYRKDLDLNIVATGEVWLGTEALKLKLVDKIQSSDDYILESLKMRNVYKISLNEEKNFIDSLSKRFSSKFLSKSLKENIQEEFLNDKFNTDFII